VQCRAKTPPFESLGAAVETAINRRPDILRQRLAVYVASSRRSWPEIKCVRGLISKRFGESTASVKMLGLPSILWPMINLPIGTLDLGSSTVRAAPSQGNLRAAQFTVEKEQALLDKLRINHRMK